MNTIVQQSPDLTAERQAAINDWCATVRALHDVYGRPIDDGDPRLEEMIADGHNVEVYTPQERGDLYWWRSDVELPPWPLELPSWAEHTEIHVHDYPKLLVSVVGCNYVEPGTINRYHGRDTVRADQSYVVFAEDYRDERSAEEHAAGTVLVNPAKVYVNVEDDLAGADAVVVGEAIARAGRDLLAGGEVK